MITAMIFLGTAAALIQASTMLHSASQCCWNILMKVPQKGALELPRTKTTNVQLYQWMHKHRS